MADNSSEFKNSKSFVKFKLDSGASDHLVNEKWYFDKINNLSNPIEIRVAKDDQSLFANKFGIINGKSNKGIDITLKNVLYVPELRDNLLSVKKMTAAGVEVRFCKEKALILNGNEVIATGYLQGNLYEVNLSIKQCVANLTNSEKNQLWHKRYGHIGQSSFQDLVSKNMVFGIDIKPEKIEFCDVCVEGKHCPVKKLRAFSKDVTPAQLWFGYKPNISSLKIFGCKAYAWLSKIKHHKLDAKSQKLVMIGYVPNGYKLWDMNSRKIITSRDVKFDENNFPYASVQKEVKPNVVVRSNMQEGDDNEVVPVTTNEDAIESANANYEEYPADLTSARESDEIITIDEDDYNEHNDDNRDIEDDANDTNNDVVTIDSNAQTPRRSQRERKAPSKFLGFSFCYSIYTEGVHS